MQTFCLVHFSQRSVGASELSISISVLYVLKFSCLFYHYHNQRTKVEIAMIATLEVKCVDVNIVTDEQ